MSWKPGRSCGSRGCLRAAGTALRVHVLVAKAEVHSNDPGWRALGDEGGHVGRGLEDLAQDAAVEQTGGGRLQGLMHAARNKSIHESELQEIGQPELNAATVGGHRIDEHCCRVVDRVDRAAAGAGRPSSARLLDGVQPDWWRDLIRRKRNAAFYEWRPDVKVPPRCGREHVC